ncbi:MAG: DNA polymerase III subunit delta [Myxococcota bacterium]|nr:DNA polymerase III subunit delta [Myxococcota bacterium]
MNLEELRAELASGGLRSAYLVAGEEALLRDDAVAAIREAALGTAGDAFDFERFDGAKTDPGALIDAVRTLPVLAPRRLVLVRDPEGRGSRGAGEALAAAVAAASEGEGTVLVVVAASADRRAGWVKAFGAARVDCEAPRRARDLVAFVRAEAARQEVALGRGAAELLAERIGPQLLILRQEIEKAGLLAGPGNEVTRAHIGSAAVDVAEEPVWDLTDAIGEGRSADALRVLSRLQAAGAPAPVVLGALVNHFRRLLRVRSGGTVSGPPFVQKKLQGQARRFSERRLIGSLRAIHETDLAIKGAGALPPDLALERLVLGLVG